MQVTPIRTQSQINLSHLLINHDIKIRLALGFG